MKQIFPRSKPFYFVWHLHQRDKRKIEVLLSKNSSNATEKNKAKAEILNGHREAECLSKILWQNSLQQKWKSLFPGFYE